MAIDWDANVLKPLHAVFGEDEVIIYTHKTGESYEITGIFDRAHTSDVEPIEGDVGINTTKPVLGVRDIEFIKEPKQGDKVYIKSVNTTFVVSDPQPDSHGGTRLELNRLK